MNIKVSDALGLEKIYWDRVCNYLASNTKRYAELLLQLRERKAKVILEIGVYSGQRAKEMIEAAKIDHKAEDIWYLGFDLFEMFEPEILEKEFSKVPKTSQEIYDILAPTGVNVCLFKGYSQETLKEFVSKKHLYPSIDYIFIDGGHALDTIKSDWEYVKELMTYDTTVIFDDYYHGTHGENDKFGADHLVENLPSDEFVAECLNVTDSFAKDFGKLDISLVKVTINNQNNIKGIS
ncbi:class I SAM-dependent methyltransferase [Litoribrevibacter albus]|uniref:Uncharacterized protein n=1 Tax=Litoribrevibacter albus TaxID=1473156 RepID=A0AA37SBH3_9GAMM|nr:class I SAM-dependent methyltransferase [Litoribrevibacter albus]GLQ32236.1 hypothetical protein GCM10007876_27150 [Litoribrevibacter albus]